MYWRNAFVLSAWLALAASAPAQILSPVSKNLLILVPPPPEDTSPSGLADMEIMLQVQAERTPEQIERAKKVDHQSPFSFGRGALGDWFDSKNLPHTAAIFEVIDRESNRLIDASKMQWRRPRPYQRDPRIRIVVGLPGNASYPSGHSAIAAVWAAVLGAAFPEDAEAFQNQVHEVMWARVLGGVHFPTDTTAGEVLGDAIGRELMTSPQMTKAIRIIRSEAAPFRSKKPI